PRTASCGTGTDLLRSGRLQQRHVEPTGQSLRLPGAGGSDRLGTGSRAASPGRAPRAAAIFALRLSVFIAAAAGGFRAAILSGSAILSLRQRRCVRRRAWACLLFAAFDAAGP